MRDLKLIIDTSTTKAWDLDINIKNGQFELLDYDNQTNEQRASIAAYKVLRSVPGYPDEGIDWMKILEDKNNLVIVDNQIKQSIQQVTTVSQSTNMVTGQFSPVYIPDEETGLYKVYVTKG